jgi:hypothetical protein
MRFTGCLALSLLTVLILPHPGLAGGAGQDKPADVAGAWAITVEIAGNTGNPTVTLKQDGGTLTGTYSSQVFGEQKVAGTIKGHAITFEFTASLEGNAVKVTYSGTVDKAVATTMTGKVSLGDLGEGTFTAKKQ